MGGVEGEVTAQAGRLIGADERFRGRRVEKRQRKSNVVQENWVLEYAAGRGM